MASLAELFREARQRFKERSALFDAALAIEAKRLEAVLLPYRMSVVSAKSRVKEFYRIRDNFLRYNRNPVREVKLEEVLRTCSDLLGLRVVIIYNFQMDELQEHIEQSFERFGPARRRVAAAPEGSAEFGYRATHWTYEFDDPVLGEHLDGLPVSTEIQLRTLLSDVWAEQLVVLSRPLRLQFR